MLVAMFDLNFWGLGTNALSVYVQRVFVQIQNGGPKGTKLYVILSSLLTGSIIVDLFSYQIMSTFKT